MVHTSVIAGVTVGCQRQWDAANIRLKALTDQTPASSQGCLQHLQVAKDGKAPEKTKWSVLHCANFKKKAKCFPKNTEPCAPCWSAQSNTVSLSYLTFRGLQVITRHNVNEEVKLVKLCYGHGNVVPLKIKQAQKFERWSHTLIILIEYMQCPIYKHVLRPKVSCPKIATREATVALKFPEVLSQVFAFITELKGREHKDAADDHFHY